MNNLKQLNTETLLQYYANAKTTNSCGGHHKGEMNEQLQLEYANELWERGLRVPKTLMDKLEGNYDKSLQIPQGIFNGDGSY
jgi:hypothetical protein